MSTPRTLVVFHVAEPSGPFKDLAVDLDWLAEARSLEVVVPGPGTVAESFRQRAPVTELPYSALTLPRGATGLLRVLGQFVRELRAFRARLRQTRPELVIAATTRLPAALAAARLERTPAIVYAAEMPAAEWKPQSLRSGGGRLLAGLTRLLATEIVACSASAARQFERRGTEAAVVYPPIRDEYAGGDGPRFRTRHGIHPGAPCVLAVGNITHGRGQDLLIRALPLIRRSLPSATCAIVGDPFPRTADLAYREQLRRLAHQLGVPGAVALTGFTDRVADAYAAADVVVNPARVPESFGRVACEALVARRPVVSARVGAIREVLSDGETALLVPPEDPRALAGAVVRLLQDADYAERIAERGRRDVLDRFAPRRSRAAFRDVIERVTS